MKNYKKSTMSLAILAALTASMHSTVLAQEAEQATNEEVEIIAVKGFRSSVIRAKDIKRDSMIAQDSIVAEDIADFPDLNLADSLQRVPGVAITREGGEGRQMAFGEAFVVDTFARKLYHVQEGGRAMRYSVAVGREGLSFRGSGVIGRKEKWPSWQPTANMVRTRPDLYAAYAGGMKGGLDNPLGARAMYLYRDGRDTMFRIHGTIDNASIGRATSAGCIRLFNQDAIDLFNRVESGAFVRVRTQEESLELEGPYMDDAYGRAVPDTPENQARLITDRELIAQEEQNRIEAERVAAEEAAKQAAKDEKRRLRICRNRGIDEAECPSLAELTGETRDAALEGTPAPQG